MTSKLTRERLQKSLKMDSKHGESKELARMALAEKASEPVILYRERNPYNGLTTGWQELTETSSHSSKRMPGKCRVLTLYRHAASAGNTRFQKLARELVVNLVDCGGLDEGGREVSGVGGKPAAPPCSATARRRHQI